MISSKFILTVLSLACKNVAVGLLFISSNTSTIVAPVFIGGKPGTLITSELFGLQ